MMIGLVSISRKFVYSCNGCGRREHFEVGVFGEVLDLDILGYGSKNKRINKVEQNVSEWVGHAWGI